MSRHDLKRFLAKFNGRSPASAAAIAQVEAKAGVRLPHDYVEFLSETNGGEGFVGSSYVILWPIEELLQNNDECGAREFAPGLLLIGTDGGGEGFAFDTRSRSMPIVRVPLVALELSEAWPVANSFASFLRELAIR